MLRRTRRITLIAVVALLFSVVLPTRTSHAQQNLLVWAQVGGVPPTISLTGVEMFDQNTAWAVGNDIASGGSSGFIYRLSWNGFHWTAALDARFDAPLHTLDVVNASNVWAVGDRGLIVHRDSSGWRPVPPPVANGSLTTVQMAGSGQEGWAGGFQQAEGQPQQALLLRFEDGTWRQDASLRDGIIVTDLELTPAGLWAAVSGRIWRFAGGQWTRENTPEPCGGQPGCFADLNDLDARTMEDIWATGNGRANCSFCWTSPWAVRRGGGNWSNVQLPELYQSGDMPHGGTMLQDVEFIDPEHGLMVGGQSFGRNGQGFDQALVLRYTNGSISRDAVPLGSGTLQDVSQLDLEHAIAVGLNGRILSYGYGPSDLSTPPQPAHGAFADQAFVDLWQRTDKPVADQAAGLRPRTWIWGPQPNTAAYNEPYAESPGGQRLVQYFDKSRMEVTTPDNARDGWYVTNGLLVVEMLTGRIQVGNNLFEPRPAAYEAVAGDRIEVNQNAPTYASLINVAYPNVCERCRQVPRRIGEIVTSRFTGMDIQEDAALARHNVTIGAYEEQLGHNIPTVFTEFFDQQGLVYENGRYVQGRLLDWVFVMGLPITEPYWIRVRVGGVEKDVLMQAFERRVLTYTPDNPPEWRVEMGNVGQHYLRWRHGV
jgi:hypothetical protein